MTKEKKITILENQAFKQEEDNKGYNKVFNVFWVIFVGFFSLIENAVIGALLCCTIVGIPAGISCFKIIPLVFKPAGRRVQINFKKHPVLNVLSFTFGGVINFIYYSLIGGLLCLTIIGIPLGRQLFKVAKFYLAPFGSEIHLDGTYTQDKDTAYDMALLMHKVYKSPDRLVKLSDGREVKAIDAIKETSKNLQKKELLKIQSQFTYLYTRRNLDGTCHDSLPGVVGGYLFNFVILNLILFAALGIIHILMMKYNPTYADNPTFFNPSNYLTAGMFVITLGVATLIFFKDLISFFNFVKLHKIYKKTWSNLYSYYPEQISLTSIKYKELNEEKTFYLELCKDIYRNAQGASFNKKEEKKK